MTNLHGSSFISAADSLQSANAHSGKKKWKKKSVCRGAAYRGYR